MPNLERIRRAEPSSPHGWARPFDFRHDSKSGLQLLSMYMCLSGWPFSLIVDFSSFPCILSQIVSKPCFARALNSLRSFAGDQISMYHSICTLLLHTPYIHIIIFRGQRESPPLSITPDTHAGAATHDATASARFINHQRLFPQWSGCLSNYGAG